MNANFQGASKGMTQYKNGMHLCKCYHGIDFWVTIYHSFLVGFQMKRHVLFACVSLFLALQGYSSLHATMVEHINQSFPDSSGNVTIKTILNVQTLDQWLEYSTTHPGIIAKGEKQLVEKKLRELCTSFVLFIRLMNSNPGYISKTQLESIGLDQVKSIEDIPQFMALFPNSQSIDRFIESKEQSLTRVQMLMIMESVPKSQRLASFKKTLIVNSNTLNDCIEVARVCTDCREELAGKCIGELKNNADHRRFLNYFGTTKYGSQVLATYNEMITQKAENLGGKINTEYPDYGPVISPDGTTMYFTRKNDPESFGGEDIYVSKLDKFGEWSKAVNISTPLNNSDHNGVYSVSQDGKELFLHNNYDEGGHNPSITKWAQTYWGDPVTQQIPNLSPKSNYHNGSLSIDGKYLVMSIKRNDSYGGRFLFWKSGGNDIYVILKDSLGNWLEPKNLGPTVNTDGEEGSVFIAADGQTIYFSSDGHGGNGRQDMYMSRRLDSTWVNWTTPVNLGPTINSSGDDDFYVIPAKGDFIYFSSDRDGYGEDDIFRIGLPMELRPKPVAVIKGSVTNKKDNTPIAAKVVYEDLETGQELGSVETNPLTGEYQIILVGGKRYAIIPTPLPTTGTGTLLSINQLNINATSTSSSNGGGSNEVRSTSKSGNASGIVTAKSGTSPSSGKSSSSTSESTSNSKQTTSNTTQSTGTYMTKNTVIAESQYIDLVDLKEYIEIEQSLVVVPIETGQAISLNNLFFQVGSFVLKKESFLELNRIVKIMEENPELKIEIGGHTDDTGSDETNRVLSEKRAYEVYMYLIKLSVSKERLMYVGYGESKPKVPNTSEANRAINRRVELKIR